MVYGSGNRRYAGYALLAVPLIVCTTWISPGRLWVKLLLVGSSVLLAFTVRWLALQIGRVKRVADLATYPAAGLFRGAGFMATVLHWIAVQPIYRRLEERLVRIFGERAVKRRMPQLSDSDSREFTQLNLWRFFSITSAVYLLFLWILWPGSENAFGLVFQDHVPALAYALLLMMLLTWVLAWVSLKLDGYRVPAELAVVLVVALIYRLPVTDTDHYYEVEQTPAIEDIEPSAYLRLWAERRPGLDPIVVTGSGGGISASAWVATVLAGLQDLFGEEFARSIALVSTTSGGSVGAMYYVDGFTDGGKGAPPTPPADTAWIVRMASRSSLGAMAWGLIYPDFARLFFPPLAFGSDRGWAIERRWAQPLPGDSRRLDRKLREWRTGVAAGWQPVQVFNATFTETGGRLLISPLAIHARRRDSKRDPDPDDVKAWQGRDFVHFYEKADLDVVTAARLSATFPFITPIARPTLDGDLIPEKQAYHVADGGYFDNFGVMSAIEFIREVRPILAEKGRKILVLEIRIGNSTLTKEAQSGEGFRMEVIGPAETLMAVRSTSQLERNDLELQLLRSVAPEVYPKPVVLELRTSTPLSWHLSDEESRRICAYWMARCSHNQRALKHIAKFLGQSIPAPPPSSLAPLCEDESAEVPDPDFKCPWLDGSA